jgi:hypothetical protein
MTICAKIISAIYKNLPSHLENYNNPKTGRNNFVYGIAYESNQFGICASAVIEEIIDEYGKDGVIKVEDLKKLIGELKND